MGKQGKMFESFEEHQSKKLEEIDIKPARKKDGVTASEAFSKKAQRDKENFANAVDVITDASREFLEKYPEKIVAAEPRFGEGLIVINFRGVDEKNLSVAEKMADYLGGSLPSLGGPWISVLGNRDDVVFALEFDPERLFLV